MRILSLFIAFALMLTLAAAAQAAPTPPTNVTPPTLTGEQSIGKMLVCNPGTWAGDPQPRLQITWYRGVVELFASNDYYVIQPKDALDRLTCRVKARNAGGELELSSAPTRVIPPPIVRLDAKLLLGLGVDAQVQRNCGQTLGRLCKMHRNEAAYVMGALTTRIDNVPLTIGIEKRVMSNGAWRWSRIRGVVGKTDDGVYKLSIRRAMSIHAPAVYRIRTNVKGSELAQAASSKYIYVKMLPPLPSTF